MTGCSVRESNRAGLARRYPAVDLFLRPDEEPELVDRLGLASAQAPVGARDGRHDRRPRRAACRTRPTSSAPGPTRSRAAPSAAALARSAPGCRSSTAATRPAPTASCRSAAGRSGAARSTRSSTRRGPWPPPGYREVTLLGQNVNSYGHDLEPEARFGHVHTARTVGRRQDREGRPGPRRADPGDRRPPHRRRRARDPAAAVRDLAPVGPVRPADRGDGRLPVDVRGAPPAGPVGQRHDAPPDGPPVHDRALPGAPGADPRGGARASRSRPTSSSGSAARPRPSTRRRSGCSRPSATTRCSRRPTASGPGRPRRASPTTCPPPRSDAGSIELLALQEGDRARAEPGVGRADDRGAGRRAWSRRGSHEHDDEEAAGTAESRDAFAHLPDGVAHLTGRSRENKLVHVAGSPRPRRPPGRTSASSTPGRTRSAGRRLDLDARAAGGHRRADGDRQDRPRDRARGVR